MSLKLNGEGAAEDRLMIVGESAFGTGEVPASWSRSSLVSSSPPDIVGPFSFAVGDGLFFVPFYHGDEEDRRTTKVVLAGSEFT